MLLLLGVSVYFLFSIFFCIQIYLEEIVSLWPKFDALGDQGKLLMTRFYSIPRGINHTNARTEMEIKRWVEVFNKK